MRVYFEAAELTKRIAKKMVDILKVQCDVTQMPRKGN